MRFITLAELRAQAMNQRHEVSIENTRLAQAKAQESIAAAGRMPTIAATVDTSLSPGGQLIELSPELSGLDGPVVVQGSPTIDRGAAAFEPSFRYGGLIGVDWKVHDFGRTNALVRSARAETRAREKEAALTRRGLVAEVDAAYLAWLGASERERFEREALDRLRARRRDLEARVQLGALAPSMLLTVDAELASAELRVAYAEDDVERVQASVEAAIGGPLAAGAQPDPGLLEIEAPTLQRASSDSSASSGSSSIAKRDDLEASSILVAANTGSTADLAGDILRARLDAMDANVDAYTKSWRPVLRVSAQVGLRGQSDHLFPVYQGSVGLSFPLWDGHQSGSRLLLAQAQRGEISARIAQHADERRKALKQTHQAIDRSTRRLDLARAFVDRANARLVDAEQRQLEGTASDQDVTSAREQKARASVEVLTAQLDRASAILSLSR